MKRETIFNLWVCIVFLIAGFVLVNWGLLLISMTLLALVLYRIRKDNEN